MKRCLDCGVRQPDTRTWCAACGSVYLQLAGPPLVPVCPRCAEDWPSRLEQGTPVLMLCAVHLEDVRQDAAERVQVIA